MNKTKKIYKKLLIFAVGLYVVFTLINQQSTINQYTKEGERLSLQLQEEKEYSEQLAKQKEKVNSIEFIEETAREKLDMYLPNERVYVDAGL